jgi:hypothetical protein
MAEIPRFYVDGFTRALNRVSESARKGLADALASIDMTQDVATVREQVIAVMQVWCGGATDQAAVLAASFYDGLREFELGERMGAVADSGRDPDATDGAVRAFAQKLVDGGPDEFIRLCLERLDYEMKVAANEAVLANGRRDRVRPRYARVPDGAETCDFCLMLASRGFVYQSEAAASHAHSGCDCRTVPSWRSRKVEGYDTRALHDRWQEAIDAKARERAERNGTTEADERRKIMEAYERAASNAKRRRRR